MKTKLLILSLAFVALAGCKKEQHIESAPIVDTCLCGNIRAEGFDQGIYWVEAANNCSGNIYIFRITKQEWQGVNVGGEWCSSVTW